MAVPWPAGVMTMLLVRVSTSAELTRSMAPWISEGRNSRLTYIRSIISVVAAAMP